MLVSIEQAHRDAGIEAVASFLRLDRIGACLAVAVTAIAAAFFIAEPILWLPVGAIALLALLLTLGLRLVERDRAILALACAVVGNWIVAVAVTIAIPQLWPVMNITALIPVVLASPHLSGRRLVDLVAAAIAVVIAVTVLGLLNDDGGALPDLDDGLEMLLVVGALVAHVIPSALTVWNNNRIQQQTVDRLVELNDELAKSSEELADSRRRVTEAADVERQRIERDLHDGAQQQLVSLGIRLRLLQSATGDDHPLSSEIGQLVDETSEAVEELRRLAHGIYPPLLESSGLSPALQVAARRSGLDVVTNLAEVGRVDPAIERAVYFAALEGLTNAAKYAAGSQVSVSLAASNEQLTLQIVDDGPGFDIGASFGTRGTHNMNDRLATVGGRLLLESAPGRGTTVTAIAPIYT